MQGAGFCYPENSVKDQSWVRALVGGLGSAGFLFECSDSDVLSPLDTRKVAGWLWHLTSSQLNGTTTQKMAWCAIEVADQAGLSNLHCIELQRDHVLQPC